MNAAGRSPQPLPFAPARWAGSGPLAPVDCLSAAWDETFYLLFRPFQLARWIELSVLCLFLGGGTSTAAFQWGFSILPGEVHSSAVFLRLHDVIAEHLSLIILVVVLVVTLGLSLLYVRCVLRFVLVDIVIKREVATGPAWNRVHRLGRNYFFWLVGVVGTVLAAGLGLVALVYPYLSTANPADQPSLLESLGVALVLAAVVLVGLLIAVVITITDDLVVPVIYAERGSLPAAWRKVWKVARRDVGTFIFYLAVRFAVAMGIGVAVLFFLFPVLMSLSSGALVSAALVNLSLRLMGLEWTWNALTMVLAAGALMVLTFLLFAVLSAVGMPGQVYLQNYGVRFIASRHPVLGAIWREAASLPRR